MAFATLDWPPDVRENARCIRQGSTGGRASQEAANQEPGEVRRKGAEEAKGEIEGERDIEDPATAIKL